MFEGVCVFVGVLVAVFVGVLVAVLLGVLVGVTVGVVVGVTVGVGVGQGLSATQLRQSSKTAITGYVPEPPVLNSTIE